MTTAEVVRPRPSVASTYHEYWSNNVNVNHNSCEQQADAMYTAAEVLEAVLAAYGRGYDAGRAQTSREYWHSPTTRDSLREARAAADAAAMRRRARAAYAARGLPDGYNYRGGAVDWVTGLPEGSGCAWLRRARSRSLEAVA